MGQTVTRASPRMHGFIRYRSRIDHFIARAQSQRLVWRSRGYNEVRSLRSIIASLPLRGPFSPSRLSVDTDNQSFTHLPCITAGQKPITRSRFHVCRCTNVDVSYDALAIGLAHPRQDSSAPQARDLGIAGSARITALRSFRMGNSTPSISRRTPDSPIPRSGRQMVETTQIGRGLNGRRRTTPR